MCSICRFQGLPWAPGVLEGVPGKFQHLKDSVFHCDILCVCSFCHWINRAVMKAEESLSSRKTDCCLSSGGLCTPDLGSQCTTFCLIPSRSRHSSRIGATMVVDHRSLEGLAKTLPPQTQSSSRLQQWKQPIRMQDTGCGKTRGWNSSENLSLCQHEVQKRKVSIIIIIVVIIQ